MIPPGALAGRAPTSCCCSSCCSRGHVGACTCSRHSCCCCSCRRLAEVTVCVDSVGLQARAALQMVQPKTAVVR
jgi:hypothetical protein